MTMKILFIDPPRDKWFFFGDVVQPNTAYLELGAFLEKNGFDVEILDCMALDLSIDSIWPYVEKSDPDIVGIGASTSWVNSAFEVFSIIKKRAPQITTVGGGVHFTLADTLSLNECGSIDFIVRGEGELTMLELVQAIERHSVSFTNIQGLTLIENGDIVRTPDRPLIKDINSLPMPAYHLVPMDRYRFRSRWDWITMNTSRGCPYSCIFCTQTKFYHRTWRAKSAKQIVEEMELLKREYNKNWIHFADDNFTLDRKRMLAFLDELDRRKLNMFWMIEARMDALIRDADLLPRMRDLGLSMVLYGIESASEEDWEYLRKGQTLEQVHQTSALLKEVGIAQIVCLMLGLRHHTQEEINHLIQLSKDLNPEFPMFMAITPFPGTDLYDEAIEKDWIKNKIWESYDFVHAIMDTETMSIFDVQRALRNSYRRFWARPTVLWERLTSQNFMVRETTWAGITGKMKLLPPKDPIVRSISSAITKNAKG